MPTRGRRTLGKKVSKANESDRSPLVVIVVVVEGEVVAVDDSVDIE